MIYLIGGGFTVAPVAVLAYKTWGIFKLGILNVLNDKAPNFVPITEYSML